MTATLAVTHKGKKQTGTPLHKQGNTSPFAGATATGSATTVAATPSTEHEMLVAVGIMGAFVLVMTMIAGIGKTAGRVAVLLMVALLVNQGIRHVNPFVDWAAAHPLTPSNDGTNPAFTVKGM